MAGYRRLSRPKSKIVTVRTFTPSDLGSLFSVFPLLEQGTSVRLCPANGSQAGGEVPPSETALGLYSSATTGKPKLAWVDWRQFASDLRIGPELSRWVWASPFSPLTFAGVHVAAQAWRNHGAVLSLGVNWAENWEKLQRTKADALSCTPTFLDLMLQHLKSGSSVHLSQISLGGELLRPQAGERFRREFPQSRFSVIYASAERGVLLKTNRLDGWYEIASLEKRYPRWRIENGELQIWKQGQWRGTGDLVELKDGLMRVIGRADRIANIAGSKVSLDEVTLCAEQVQGVRRAIAFAEPNSVSGQIVCLRFTPEEGVSGEELRRRLQDHLRGAMPKEAWPRRWEIAPVELGANSKRVLK